MLKLNSNSKKRRLLIVERDSQAISKLLQVCEKIEIEALVSSDPAEALFRARRESWAGAILGFNGGNEAVLALADQLSTSLVSLIFVVDHPGEGIPPRHDRVPQLVKPLQRQRIMHLLTTQSDAAQHESKGNPVLTALLAEDAALRNDLTPFPLQARQTLFHPGCPLREIIFIESGLCAIIGRLGENETEIGLIGNEGVAGAWIAADVDTSPFRLTVQLDGMAAALPAHSLKRSMEETPKIRSILARYQHQLDMQFAAAATANATLSIESRLARWFVMCSDRIGSDIPIVHDDLSTILSVRRPGVTQAMHQLEKSGLIEPRRGFVRVVDRERLVILSLGARRRTPSVPMIVRQRPAGSLPLRA